MRQYKIFDVYKEQNIRQLFSYCEQLLDNKMFVASRLPTLNYYKGIWNDESIGRSYLFKLHAFAPLSYLLSLYEETDDITYLLKAKELYMEWKWSFEHVSFSHSMWWHDHVTALRLLTIVKLYTLLRYKGLISELEKQNYYAIINEHCNKLLAEDFYRPSHNHGLDQDLALFISSFVMYQETGEKQYRLTYKVATKRLTTQLNCLILEDGSYLEHSPKYAILVFYRLHDFLNFIKTHSINKLLQLKIKRKLTKLLYYILRMEQPDGKIPLIGDSDPIQFDVNRVNVKQYIYRMSCYVQNLRHAFDRKIVNNENKGLGRFYSKIFNNDHFFKEGNIIVSNNSKHGDEHLKLWFYSAFHTRVHKHHDDLAFMVYYKNRPIFIDAGKYKYNYQDPMRKLVVSNYGHNTIRINNKDTNLSRLNLGKSQLTDVAIKNNIVFTGGMHTLYKGIVHKRLLLFIKPYDLLIIDEVKGNRGCLNEVEQIFNLNPELDYQVGARNSIVAHYKDEVVFRMKSLYTNSNNILTHHSGQHIPPLGWHVTKQNEIKPCETFTYKSKTSMFRKITHLSFNKNNNNEYKVVKWDQRDLIITTNYSTDTFKVRYEDYKNKIFLNNKLLKHKHTMKKTLLDSIRHIHPY